MAAFPTFAGGESVHLPFTQESEFWNTINRQPHGWQYSYNRLSSALKRWQFELVLTDTDLATLQTFWDSMKGRYGEFSFTDPDTGVTSPKCRFDQEELSITSPSPDENRVAIAIQEYV